MEHVLIQVIYNCFQLSLSFLSFYHSFRQPTSLLERQKFRDENGTFSDVCVCLCDKTRVLLRKC